jgi:lambda family phage portal protein
MTFRASMFDHVLLALAPQAGLRRLQAKASAAALLRAFEGASRDRRLGSWRTPSTGPNSENEVALEVLRNRARDLTRNNKIVASAVMQFAGQTVGTGINPRAVDDRKSLRQKANDAWARFVDTCDPEGQQDFHGIMSTTAGTLFRDGECLHLWLDGPSGAPYSQIRVLEADHLDESRTSVPQSQTDRRAGGVEFDRWSRRLAYWLYPVHPGETNVIRIPGQSERIEARFVDHYYHVARPGQIRGVSWLAPSIVSLRGLDDVTEATIWRKRIEACIGLVVRSPEIQGSIPVVGTQTTDSKGRTEESLAPGKILRFGPGEDATAFQPSSSSDTIDFMRSQLYAFCATTGIPYHAVTGDVSQANYSSLRAATLAGYVLLDMVQWLVLAPRIKAAWRRVMEREALLTGERRLETVRCELSMPVRPWVDPVKEITAKIMEIRAGLQAMPDALAERGMNWEQQLAEIEAFLKALDAAQIVLDIDPRKINHAGAAQAMQATVASSIGDNGQSKN